MISHYVLREFHRAFVEKTLKLNFIRERQVMYVYTYQQMCMQSLKSIGYRVVETNFAKESCIMYVCTVHTAYRCIIYLEIHLRQFQKARRWRSEGNIC